MAKLLITGANGFIGRHLLAHLCERHSVTAIRRPGTHVAEFLRHENVYWVEQDLAGRLDRACLPRKLDAVVHLAQSRNYRQFPDFAQDIFGVNTAATLDLLEYARSAGVTHFVYASSGGVYAPSYERLVESAPVEPLNFYLTSKYASELLVGNYSAFFTTVVLRFFFVYGPGQRDMLVPRLLSRVSSDEVVSIEGNPGLTINPVFVRDAVNVIEPAMRLSAPDVFNIAGDEVVSILDLVKLCEQVTGRDARVQHLAGTARGNLVADNSKAKTMLGFAPVTRLLDGLRQMTGVGAGEEA